MTGSRDYAVRDYAVVVRPLSKADGGGYEATVPDLPGCMSDGETMQEAVTNVQGAILSWIEAAQAMGRRVPAPGSGVGQWRQRVPASLHVALKELARREGVSLNMLVTNILAQQVGRAMSDRDPSAVD